jgi:hypothetical protein
MVGISVFFLAGAAAIALYIAFAPNTRAIDESFADIAVKMRISMGALDGGDITDDNLLRMMFRWAAKRVPPPDVDSPTGEKLQQTLAQAGFLKSSAAQTYQVIRVMLAVGCAVIGLIIGLILHSSASQPLLFAVAGAVVGIFVPSYILGRRVRQPSRANSRTCLICW